MGEIERRGGGGVGERDSSFHSLSPRPVTPIGVRSEPRPPAVNPPGRLDALASASAAEGGDAKRKGGAWGGKIRRK